MLVTHSCISVGVLAARCSTCCRACAFGRTRLSSASRANALADLGPVLEKWPTLK